MTMPDDPRLQYNTDLPDWPAYVGGDVASADLWGTAPERGRAIEVVEKALGSGGIAALAPLVVDALIEAGILPQETGPGSHRFLVENLPRHELIRRCRALYAEQHEVGQILAEALGVPKGDGRYCPADEYMVLDDTPVTLADKAAKELDQLRKGKK